VNVACIDMNGQQVPTALAIAFALALAAVGPGLAAQKAADAGPSPEERCSHYAERDRSQCVRDVNEEDAQHAKFLRDSALSTRRVEIEHERVAAARAACERRGIRLGTVALGMRAQVVKDCGWGEPERSTRRTTAAGVTEVWWYHIGHLVLVNSKVREIVED